MKTIELRIKEALLQLAKECSEKEQTGFVQLYQHQNDMIQIDEKYKDYVESQKELGYSEKDLNVTAYLSTNNEWFSWIAFLLKNEINNTLFQSDNVRYIPEKELTKSQLLEAKEPFFELVRKNRSIIRDKVKALEIIEKNAFYRNNLKKMCFDQETHDFVLSVQNELEQKKLAEKEAREAKLKQEKTELKKWAETHGNDYLKLKIKHDQNWFQEACIQKALTLAAPEFLAAKDFNYENCWEVKNASLDQLRELEAVKLVPETNNNLTIRRYKIIEDYEPVHYTYLEYTVTIAGNEITLAKQIEDQDEF
jgi:hypothetical protein